MDLSSLLELYRNSSKIKHLAAHINAVHPARIHLKGLLGSSDAFVATSLLSNLHMEIQEQDKEIENPKQEILSLFIISDKEEAAYFLNNLENLAGERDVMFFPDSYKKTSHLAEIDNANVLLRAEVLNRVRKGGRQLMLVTYPEALCEKVVTKKNLSKNTIDIRTGEEISIAFLVDFLNSYDFQRTDFVVEPGQFSVRGGIVDIFSFASEMPCRIEFSGDQVSSIRAFDVADQLSVTPLGFVTIIPNVQTHLVAETRESFFDFIPPDSLVWIKDLKLMLEFIGKLYEKIAADSSQLFVGDGLDVKHSDLFNSAEETLLHLEKFSVIEFGNQFHFTPQLVQEFKISPQPSFNKNFEMLTQNLKQNKNQGYTNFIFADTSKQIERIYAIFEDILAGKSEMFFHSVLMSIHEGFIDHELKTACYTDHQIFDRYHRFRLKQTYSKSQQFTLRELNELKPGDYVTHIDHGIGKYAGLEKIEMKTAHGSVVQESIRLVYKDNDIVYVSIHSLHRISKYSGKEGEVPKLHKLGSNAWANLKEKTKKRVKDIAKDLIQLYAKRKATQGFAFSPDTYLQTELEASFIYEDTPDQLKSTLDVKKDMEQPHPMDRLICGDVGFGKTEIAIRAAFKSVTDGKQVAVLVPTTILALQHFKTFRDRLKDFPCKVDYINRFKSPKEQKEIIKNIAEGKLDIIIGTHRLLSKEVNFKDLGLLVIDEEQKFGVAAKERLKSFKVNVDTLTLTATPIPRTLQFSMMGARDLSIINTPPPNRYPITTELKVFGNEVFKDAILYEVQRGGQAFVVHNRIQNIHEVAEMIKRLCPGVRVAVGHGQMDGKMLEEIMLAFVEGNFDVLVSTTIIESGLDIPNANTIIINQAQNFGLSDLHQMRGRVGRSNKKAFCYLITPSLSVLTPEARQRLKAIEDFSELGSGINIALRDLDIRGAGNLLGGEQSGFISEIGFDMYQKILDEAIRELKDEINRETGDTEQKSFAQLATPGSRLFVKDCVIDTDLEILIPDHYVENITERLNLYKEMDELETEEQLMQFEKNLIDRFGAVPQPTLELLDTLRLRWLASRLGFEKIVLRNDKLIGYFPSHAGAEFFNSDTFGEILNYVKTHPGKCRMKEQSVSSTSSRGETGNDERNKFTLTFLAISSVNDANAVLKAIVIKNNNFVA